MKKTPEELLIESEIALQKRLDGRSTPRLDKLARESFSYKNQKEIKDSFKSHELVHKIK